MANAQPQQPHLQQLLDLVPQDDDLELSQDDLAALSLAEESESSRAQRMDLLQRLAKVLKVKVGELVE